MKDNRKKDDDILKDGERLIVKLAMMDSTNNFNRPGYRQPAVRDATSYADRASAYKEYHDRQTNAWRGRDDTLPITGAGTHNLRGEVGNHHPPYGAYPYRAEAVGAACSIDGFPGRLSEVNIAGERWLVCKPTSSRTDSDDDDVRRKKIRRNARNQEESTEEISRDHKTADVQVCPYCEGSGIISGNDDPYDIEAAMENVTPPRYDVPDQKALDKMRNDLRAQYAQMDRELSNAWRKG